MTRNFFQEESVSTGPDDLNGLEEGNIALPASFGQQRLWFIQQLNPENFSYNIPIVAQIKGPLDIEVLRQSLYEVVQRHEILRTSFSLVEGQLMQIIASSLNISLPITDLRACGGIERAEKIKQIEWEAIQQPFDLTQRPLFRTNLFHLGEQEYLFLFVVHHSIFDGWSLGIFEQELSTLYTAFSQGQRSPLPALSIQYADFAVWQRQWLQGTTLERQLDYWKRQLAGVSPLELPVDYPHPPVKTYQGAFVALPMPSQLLEQLRDLSQRNGVTLFMTLLGTFQALLARYTGQTDISIGTPIANRVRQELEGLIGFFVNTLVLRTDLSGNPSFVEILQRVRSVTLQAYTHQDVPFEQLVEMLQPERDVSRSPLFQVMFAMQQVMISRPEQEQKVKFSEWHVEHHSTKFDLTLNVVAGPQDWQCGIEYNTDLFESGTIHRFLEHWLIVLRHIVLDAQTSLSALPLLSEAEKHRLLVEWNPLAPSTEPSQTIQTLFAAQAASTPDSIALQLADEYLTYGQLDALANQLAHCLQTDGVGLEVIVGVALDRSLALCISLLAILKAGGAYLPLDPSYPSERLAFMLTDSCAPVLVTRHDLMEHSPVPGVRVLHLDTDWPENANEPLTYPIIPDSLAYVIYTSGSTGTPKGVLVSHANVLRLLTSTHAWFQFNEHDTWTLFHSYAFDFSVWELWGALLSGGKLIVVPFEVSRSPEVFFSQVAMYGVTILNQTPSAFLQFMRAEESSALRLPLALRRVIFGGEALAPGELRPWFDRHGEQEPQLINMYGITETTVHVSYRPLRLRDAHGTSGSVIGCPLPDLQVYVLDSSLQPAPIGVAGQMYVGGRGLSRGYLRRAELTAERFIPHPFSTQPGKRLYQTGDLARFRADGELEYLGRIDDQVKIRGFRIELGEIEAALAQYATLQACVVIAREDTSGDRRLVAYVIAEPETTTPSSDELRRFLMEKLPNYMVPAAFVFLDEFPLTRNGKLDRQALPQPGQDRPELDEALVPPRTSVEEILASIWMAVLGIEQVGIHDNFFSLGGDSIKSIRVLSLAQERGMHFSLQHLFRYQTIGALARVVASEEYSTLIAEQQTRPFSLLSHQDHSLLPDDVEDAYPLTMLQIGMLFHSEYTPAAPMYHNISYGQIQAPYNILKLRSAVKQLVLRHPVLRTSFDLSTFTEPLQLVHRNVSVPIRVDDLRHLSSSEQERVLEDWIAGERHRRFEWTQAPLLRLQVHRLNEATFRLTITEHHSILDGWSVASLFTELVQRYMSLVENDMSLDLPPLTSSFGEFVALERETLANEAAHHYWAQKLVGVISVRLPRWTSATPGSVPDMRNLSVPLSQELSDSLKIVASKLNVPLKSVLLAAHIRVLGLLSGQTDILTGLVTNGRLETADGELVLGLFLNTLPYRQQLTGDSWANLIRATFENEREALPFRRYPLARIQQEQGGGALFETLFNFVHFHVYRNLQKWQIQSFSEENDVGQNNFTLSTEFGLDVLTSRVGLSLVYDLTQISSEQIQAIAAYYVNALTALITEPEANYTTSSLLTDYEKQQLLRTWNDTSYDFTPAQSICDVFEACVERFPDAGAVCIEDVQITYQELDERANQLAHYLQQLGVGPEVTVGLCVDSGLELLIGLWGILKAGGAYVPLDPDAPIHRHLTILNDAAVAVLVTQTRFAHLSATLPLAHVYLDSNWTAIAQAPATPPVRMGNAHNAAYILYTSGSTGQPKGVVVEHRQLLNYTHSIIQRLAFASVSHFALLHPLSVDFGITTLFAALCTGGRLAMLPRIHVTDPQSLASFLECQGIECLKLTPSHLSALQATLPNGCLLPQRLLILGGERCSTAWVESLRPPASECAILNHYGPTETTVGVLTYLVPAAQSALPTAMVPLGRPLANTRIYLLDPSLQPVPVGVPGEIYIGGANVTRGYLGRADLTAESYLPDPFSGEPGGRLYKTGDRARYQPDGLIEFLGRVDEQVKIRGYRVEPTEVAHVLRQHGAVRDSIVLAHAEDGLDQRLIAYVVTDEATILTSEELSSYLQTQIPAYMLPAAFVFIDKLPLLPHGKVDRQRLAALASAQAREKEKVSFVAPRTPIEARLVEIWAEIFKVEQVGINDDFFELGGHSLLAMQIISRVRLAFQIDLPIRFLFEIRTIVNLALAIEQVQYMESESDAM